MIGIMVLMGGLIGMTGLWLIAWQLWQQAVELETEPNEGAAALGATGPSPELAEVLGLPISDAAPIRRVHVDSSDSTTTFCRQTDAKTEPLGGGATTE